MRKFPANDFDANPIPQVNQIDPEKIETAITDALALADEKSISGKALTISA